MSTSTLSHSYAKAMANQPYGYALYDPESNLVLKPATCGYLTESGSWTPVLDLSDTIKLVSLGLTPFSGIERANTKMQEWGPRISTGMKHASVDLKGGASIPAGIPTKITALMSFSTEKDVGAVLVTKGSVVKDAVYHNEPYRAWCKANMASLLQKWPDIRDRGLWVVTSTWSATQAGINLWRDTKKIVMVGFETSFAPAGEIGPSGSWHAAQSDTGWVIPTSKNPFERQVLFFGGIYFRYRAPNLLLKEAQLRESPYQFRGTGSFIVVDPRDGKSELVVEMEEFGEEEKPPPAEQAENEEF